jgi:ATP-dependent exoDNAse (exonuclease V) beta subunit
MTRRDRQQLQRLLYVMSTRAKRTLVFVDDEMLFASQRRRTDSSAGQLLGFDGGTNRDVWSVLPETTSLSMKSLPDQSQPAPEIITMPHLSRESAKRAVGRANDFPRRITPHALASQEPDAHDESEPEKQIEREEDQSRGTEDGPGILYGTWWHELGQTIPWQKPMAAWQQRFLEANARSPHPERSQREWEFFCRSELGRWLARPGRLVQVEIPFLWRETDQPCLEGVMDLAVYAEDESAWRVIDWKTNRVGSAGSNGLVEMYRGQIEAYVSVLRKMLSAEVRGSLYLTRTGEWVPVE